MMKQKREVGFNMNWMITCRRKEEDCLTYQGLTRTDPEFRIRCTDGEGGRVRSWQWRAVNRSERAWEGILRLELHFEKKNPRFLMPAFLYGRNKGEWADNGKWHWARLREGAIRMPYSPWWMVRSDRLSHPASLVFDEGRVMGLSADPYFRKEDGKIFPHRQQEDGAFYQYGGFGCSLEDGFVAYTLGYENAPYFFLNSDTVYEREPLGANCFVLQPGEEVSGSLYVYDYEAESPLGLQWAVEDIYERFHEAPRKGPDIRQATEELSGAIAEDSWRPEGKNYATQVYEREDGSLYFNEWFSISWTGGVEVAVPVLMAALRLGDEKMRCQALSCIQNVVDHSLNPASGLPYDGCENGIWSTQGWWKDHLHAKGHSSYLVGQAVFYILKGYEYEKKLKNAAHEDWLCFVKGVVAQMERTKNGDGEYPYIWSEETGAGLEYDAFSGAWCLACCAYLSFLTGDDAYLEEMRKSERHYYGHYLKRMECYGTPLDTDKAVDSEGILAYIKAVRYLHALTGEALYLTHLREALGYEYTFKFCYNSPVKVPPLSENGWSSCGGSVTSTCNPHIHPMSNNVVDEMLYYLKEKEDAYVRSRMQDTVRWGCQTYNRYDGEYDYGRKGWMSERFCHSQALLVEKYPDGSPASTWFALLPWGGSNIVEGMTGDLWEQQCV